MPLLLTHPTLSRVSLPRVSLLCHRRTLSSNRNPSASLVHPLPDSVQVKDWIAGRIDEDATALRAGICAHGCKRARCNNITAGTAAAEWRRRIEWILTAAACKLGSCNSSFDSWRDLEFLLPLCICFAFLHRCNRRCCRYRFIQRTGRWLRSEAWKEQR